MVELHKYRFELKGEEIELYAPNYQIAFKKAYKYYNRMGFACTGYEC